MSKCKPMPAIKRIADGHLVRVSTVDLAFHADEPRDSHGRWVHIGGNSLTSITRHLRGLPQASKVDAGPHGIYTKSGPTFAPFEPGPSLSPEELGVKINSTGIGSTKTPHGYSAKSELIDQAGLLKVATTSPEAPKGSDGLIRSRMSAIANANPELLDDPEVRTALQETNDIGAHRLITSHDYAKNAGPERAKMLDALQKSREEAQKKAVAKAAKKALLEDLNNKVSDYEFNQTFGVALRDDGQDIKDMLKAHPELLRTAKGKSLLLDHPELTGKPPSYAQAAKEYDWAEMDAQGGDPKDAASLHMEHEAQITSEFWHDTLPNDAPAVDQYAKSLWEAYQNPQSYASINTMLRTGKKTPDSNTTVGNLRRYVAKMFEDAGTTTKEPMTLYRAIRSSDQPGHNWAEIFKPGTVFTDKGIMSCTAHRRFAQGWLNNDPVGNEEDNAKPNDVVLEIRTPAGQRIVGGSKQFIETMLPPGTKLRIISNEQRTAKEPYNPLGALAEDPFTYTHVVAEVA